MKIRIFLSHLLGKLSRIISFAQKKIYTSNQEDRLKPWFYSVGDKTLRLDYDLDQESVVFDLGGGYEGQWASDIFSKYQSNIYIFEPVKGFYNKIQKRFCLNSKIKVYQFGLSSESKEALIYLNQAGSSIYRNFGKSERIYLKCVKEFIEQNHIKDIALMKINIEGGEYDLLEYLVKAAIILKVQNLQVQFHDFVEKAEQRMFNIQQELSKTHFVTYQYPFIWENWQRKQGIKENGLLACAEGDSNFLKKEQMKLIGAFPVKCDHV